MLMIVSATCSETPTSRSAPVRKGTVLAFLALVLVVLVGFLALAIDIGMLAIARSQAQNAADVAALTAARSLNGDPTTSYNQSLATTNAQAVVSYNTILHQPMTGSQVALTYGTYDYNQSSQTFAAKYPGTANMPYTAVTATVTAQNIPTVFGKVLGTAFLPAVSATAQAAHRPRDIALVMDLSGSMRFGTCNRFDFGVSNPAYGNNPDPLIPTFGAYSSSSAAMQGPSTVSTSATDSYAIPPSNVTVGNSSYSLTYINSFYQNAAYAPTLVRAFDSYSSGDSGNTWQAPSAGGTSPQLPSSSYASAPGGDAPLYKNGSTTTYAQTVKDITGSTTRNQWWELDGYGGCTNGTFNNADTGSSTYPSSGAGTFYGYTQGPGYYGETFFIWPPDPRRPLSSAGATTTVGGTTTGGADALQINGFLQEFGYTSSDFNNSSVSTTLSSSLTSTATSLTVASISGFPTTTPFRIVVGSEIMIVTARGGTGSRTWTVTRHADTTSAASASNGAAVGLSTGPPLCGIYSVTTTSGSQVWPWAQDGGSTLGTYLTTNVYLPGGTRKLLTTDAVYQRIMRLYNWNYVVDTVGTTPCDWRLRFFGTDDNTKLFNSSNGEMNLPGGSTYTINYNEILRWIAAAPNPFPSQLRAGRIKYYGSIPTAITGTWPSYGSTDQRFWAEFIDYVLGFRQTSAGVYQDISNMAGYGTDFSWGTVSRSAPPTNPTQYMSYSDNPARPRLRFWFGPLMMVDYLNNYNMDDNVANYFYMQPGDSYEAPLYTGKQGFLAAIDTMKNNHPNDWATVVQYSWPRTSATDSTHRFNCVSCPLGTNYAYAKSALLFPFSTINADGTCNNTEVTPYDSDPATGSVPSANFVDTPRADGDTCFAMGLMLSYNQFVVTTTSDATLRSFVTASPITFPTGMAGGMGRKGAQKVILFETDGLPNCSATASLVSGGSYNYYKIRYDMNKPYSSEYPSINALDVNDPTVLSQVYSLVDQLKSDYSTSRNPFRLYAFGFGPVFSGPQASSALTTLQTMQYHAGTQNDTTTALPSNQVITGTDAQMSSRMIDAFTSVLQSGVQVALIK
jgi:Flp pilus assembly protein TadG